jgi:hypothetical protein
MAASSSSSGFNPPSLGDSDYDYYESDSYSGESGSESEFERVPSSEEEQQPTNSSSFFSAGPGATSGSGPRSSLRGSQRRRTPLRPPPIQPILPPAAPIIINSQMDKEYTLEALVTTTESYPAWRFGVKVVLLESTP